MFEFPNRNYQHLPVLMQVSAFWSNPDDRRALRHLQSYVGTFLYIFGPQEAGKLFESGRYELLLRCCQYIINFKSKKYKILSRMTTAGNEQKTNGRWTKQEHQNFLLGLQMYGKNWKKIQDLIGTRNGSQIRSHAQKFFLKFKQEGSQNCGFDYSQLQERDSEVANSKQESSNDAKLSDHSYFLSKIVQYSTNQQEFDLWAMMIDNKVHEKQMDGGAIKRKGSFVEFDEISSELQKMSSPTKKIKA